VWKFGTSAGEEIVQSEPKPDKCGTVRALDPDGSVGADPSLASLDRADVAAGQFRLFCHFPLRYFEVFSDGP
jgi:hypothetical protein